MRIIERHPNLTAAVLVVTVYVAYVNWKTIVLAIAIVAIVMFVYAIAKLYTGQKEVESNRLDTNKTRVREIKNTSSTSKKALKESPKSPPKVYYLREMKNNNVLVSRDSSEINPIDITPLDHPNIDALVKTKDESEMEIDMAYVDSLSGREFELFTGELLKSIGYQNVTVTKSSGDQGIDVLGTLDKQKVAFQCKHYQGHVGNRAVQELYTGAAYYNCDTAILVSNSLFTDSACILAKRLKIKLWDRNKLSNLLSENKISMFKDGNNNTLNAQRGYLAMSTGLHIIGRDIDPGRYKILSLSGRGILSGKDLDIALGSDPDKYTLPSYTTSFKRNERIKVSGIPKLYLFPITDRHYQKKITPGTWLVGIDIRPGFYNIVAQKGYGRVRSSNNEFDEILSDSPTESYEVPSVLAELLNGQEIITDVAELLLIEQI